MRESLIEDRIGGLYQQAQEDITLSNSTNDPRINAVLKGITGIFEHFFSDRIRGYYVVGSYANGTAVSTSDVDVHPLFKSDFHDPKETSQVYTVRDLCNQLSLIELNVDPWPESFGRRVYSGLFQLVALPIYGSDIRSQFPLPPLDAYTRRTVNVGGLLKVRQSATLQYPVHYPDPEGEFYGYDRRVVYDFDGFEPQGTKDLISVAYSIVLGRLAMMEQRYITGKAEAFQRYQKHLDDEWTDFVSEVWQKCRVEWEYKVPSSDKDRKVLSMLCQRMLDFENFYLILYRSFMLDELKAPNIEWLYSDSDYRTYCLSRFETVIYPHDEAIREALQPHLTSENEEWQQAARTAMDEIRNATQGA